MFFRPSSTYHAKAALLPPATAPSIQIRRHYRKKSAQHEFPDVQRQHMPLPHIQRSLLSCLFHSLVNRYREYRGYSRRSADTFLAREPRRRRWFTITTKEKNLKARVVVGVCAGRQWCAHMPRHTLLLSASVEIEEERQHNSDALGASKSVRG